jgi:hypothetical protein
MDGLVNQSWRDAFIQGEVAPKRDIAGRKLARLLAQQYPRGNARFAPTGIVARLAFTRHDPWITQPARAVKHAALAARVKLRRGSLCPLDRKSRHLAATCIPIVMCHIVNCEALLRQFFSGPAQPRGMGLPAMLGQQKSRNLP